MNFIVTTTIHRPTEAIIKFCKKTDWTFIIVGDLKTPHEEYAALKDKYKNVIYLHPEYQESEYKELSDIIGWNTIERRNIGFITAYNIGADIIATVDDDNIPYDSWGKDLLVNKEAEVDVYLSQIPVFDPLSVTNNSHLWHRGFPVEYIHSRHNIRYGGKEKRKVLVQADLWDGDPDVDAIERMIFNPLVKFDNMDPYCSNVMSPFNSQNTFLSRECFPTYAVLPFIGRMDDVWGSYLFQKSFPGSVVYNKASVYQERNRQSLKKNMRDELIGYEDTLSFIQGEYELPEVAKRFYDVYQKQFKI